jgi:hypothetical protein
VQQDAAADDSGAFSVSDWAILSIVLNLALIPAGTALLLLASGLSILGFVLIIAIIVVISMLSSMSDDELRDLAVDVQSVLDELSWLLNLMTDYGREALLYTMYIAAQGNP